MTEREPEYAITFEQAAQRLKCSTKTISRRVKAGQLRKIGQKWITVASLEAYARSGGQEGDAR